MRMVWIGLGLAAAAAFVLAGCATSEPSKIPKHAEEYTVPPVEDARYSRPPDFPKNTLNQDRIPTATLSNDPSQSKSGPSMGRSGGMSNF